MIMILTLYVYSESDSFHFSVTCWSDYMKFSFLSFKELWSVMFIFQKKKRQYCTVLFQGPTGTRLSRMWVAISAFLPLTHSGLCRVLWDLSLMLPQPLLSPNPYPLQTHWHRGQSQSIPSSTSVTFCGAGHQVLFKRISESALPCLQT